MSLHQSWLKIRNRPKVTQLKKPQQQFRWPLAKKNRLLIQMLPQNYNNKNRLKKLALSRKYRSPLFKSSIVWSAMKCSTPRFSRTTLDVLWRLMMMKKIKMMSRLCRRWLEESDHFRNSTKVRAEFLLNSVPDNPYSLKKVPFRSRRLNAPREMIFWMIPCYLP